MSTYSIAVIPGDAIGREVTPAAFEVARRAAANYGDVLEPKTYDWGSDRYLQSGAMMAAESNCMADQAMFDPMMNRAKA